MNMRRLLFSWWGLICCLIIANISNAQSSTIVSRPPVVISMSHSEIEVGEYVNIMVTPNSFSGDWSISGPGIHESHKVDPGKVFEKKFAVNTEGLLNYTITFRDASGHITYVDQKTLKSESLIKNTIKLSASSFLSSLIGAFVAIFSIYAKELIEYKIKVRRVKSIFKQEVNFFLSKLKKSCEAGSKNEILSSLCPKVVNDFDNSGISTYDIDGSMRKISYSILSPWEKLKLGTITIKQFSTEINSINIK